MKEEKKRCENDVILKVKFSRSGRCKKSEWSAAKSDASVVTEFGSEVRRRARLKIQKQKVL